MKPLSGLVFILLLITPVHFVETTVAQVAQPESTLRTHALKVNVDDMEKALAFYRDKLAFEVQEQGPNNVVLKSANGGRLILNRVSKLRTVTRADTKLSFTLQVNDLDQAIERMKALGVEFGEEERRKEGVGYAIFIKDPFGRLISLMHQTIVKTEPFKEPKIYNYGFLVPDMQSGRDFYTNKLGFVVRSERYLPLDLPLGHKDKSFAFMLHYRPGVTSIKNDGVAAFNTLVLETTNLAGAAHELKGKGVKILNCDSSNQGAGKRLLIEDPFGNVSEIVEVEARSGH